MAVDRWLHRFMALVFHPADPFLSSVSYRLASLISLRLASLVCAYVLMRDLPLRFLNKTQSLGAAEPLVSGTAWYETAGRRGMRLGWLVARRPPCLHRKSEISEQSDGIRRPRARRPRSVVY